MMHAGAAEGIITAAAAAIAAAATLGAMLMRVGRREGKVDEILDRLTKMTERHDAEIRDLQLGQEIGQKGHR